MTIHLRCRSKMIRIVISHPFHFNTAIIIIQQSSAIFSCDLFSSLLILSGPIFFVVSVDIFSPLSQKDCFALIYAQFIGKHQVSIGQKAMFFWTCSFAGKGMVFYKIKQMKILVLVMLLSLIGLLKACGNSNCSNNCQICSTVNACTYCCTNFGLFSFMAARTVTVNGTNSLQTITVTQCSPCLDNTCNVCSFTSGVQTCTSCQSGYGYLIDNPWACEDCTSSNAQSCKNINNCDSNMPWRSRCVNCPTYAFFAPDKCLPCYQIFRHCQKCTSLQCYDCAGNYNLNTSNYQQCVPCTFSNCLFCVSGPVCHTCISGYYKDSSNVCQHCPIPCYTCTSTKCQSCIGSSYLLKNGTCVPCLDVAQTPSCMACGMTFSTALNKTVQICYTCLNASYLDSANGKCMSCVSPCETCSSSYHCFTCLNDTYYLDTSSSNYSCTPCSNNITHCKNCFTKDICSVCDEGYNIIFKPDQCTRCSDAFQGCDNCSETHCTACLPGYLMTIDFKCGMNLNCSSNCTSCEDGFPSNCITCPDGSYADNKVCLPCLDICLTCSSSTNCILCHRNYYYVSNTCLVCPNMTYYLDTLKDCINCSAYCNTCSVLGCDNCDLLFVISIYDHKCVDLCGDGYIVTLPCDAAIGIANDGCSDTCQIQKDYNCTYTNQSNPIANSSVVSVQVSTCSYIGDISISVSKASQALFSNQVQLSFKVSPYLIGMPDGSEGQTYLKTIFNLSPFTDFTISIDASSESITFTIPYEADISNIAMILSVNYQNITANSMFQYMKNKVVFLKMNEILSVGRLGEYHQASQYSLNKGIYAYCLTIVILSYFLLLVGLVSRQLAALQNMILYQTIFLLVAFREGPCNFYLQGLIALRYSTGFDFSGKNTAQIINTKFYNYGINAQSLLYQYNLHFYILFVPIILSFFFMLYRIKNKHLPVKKDFGRSAAEELIGYTLLYLIIFNFYGLFAYTDMYLQSKKVDELWNIMVLGASLLLTIFSWSNLIFRPQAVGSFRSAFGSYKNCYFVQQSKMECVRKVESFFTWRINGQEWKQSYHRFTTNFYFFLLGYQISSAFCIIANMHVVLLGLQILIFFLLFMTKPYLKIVENARSLLMSFTLILSNLINFTSVNSYLLTLTISALLLFHLALTIFTTVKFARFEILKQCNERSKVVRKLFKVDENCPKAELHNHHKEVINQLIEKYHQLGIQEKLVAYSPSRPAKEPEKQEAEEKQEEKKAEATVKDQVSEHENMYTEERILAQQNQHLRYLQGMQFYCKYGNQIDNEIIKQHYSKL